MISVTSICNLALGNLRSSSINNIDDPSIQAQQCKLRYPLIKDSLLRDYMWNFASKIAPLALLDKEVPSWGYVYAYPNNCLKIDTVFNSSAVSKPTPFEIINLDNERVIVSDYPDLSITYRYRCDESVFPSDFTKVLSLLLSSDLAIPLIGSDRAGQSLNEKYNKLFNDALRVALSNNIHEGYREEAESEFITVRNY